jgi:hypothetical protein
MRTVYKLMFAAALFGLYGLSVLSCASPSVSNKNDSTAFIPDSLLRVKSYLDIAVDSNGHLPRNPYVIQLKSGNKQLLVIGTEHSNDTGSAMFDEIEKLFYQFKPEVIVNEGGTLTKTYPDRNTAVQMNGELGLEKFLADQLQIITVCGDMPEKLEFDQLSSDFSQQEALLYFASERFVFPYLFGEYEGDFETLYSSRFINGYLIKKGISLSPEQQRFDYYNAGYQKWFGYAYHPDSIRQHDFVPFSRSHHFCEVSRKSKELRDRYLLSQIRNQLAQHNRVMVVYGGWHVLAIEEALPQIMLTFGDLQTQKPQ